MSHISETADLESQIEALIKKAGDSLRQQLDSVRREAPTADQVSQRPPAEPASGNVADNTASTLESER
jgi:hypothetical protein